MTWTETSPYSWSSGDFVVTKNWTAAGWVWMAFRGRDPLGRFRSESGAKTYCEKQGSNADA